MVIFHSYVTVYQRVTTGNVSAIPDWMVNHHPQPWMGRKSFQFLLNRYLLGGKTMEQTLTNKKYISGLSKVDHTSLIHRIFHEINHPSVS